MLPTAYFERFRKTILELPLKGSTEKYQRAELICSDFQLFSEGGLDVYYAPFHYLNGTARVALIGLTPGWTQMEQAFRTARRALDDGFDGAALFRRIDRTGSFSGSMRKNLVNMLDGIGLNVRLGIATCHDLFDDLNGLAHLTSAVSAPIFRDGENYRGYNPRLLDVPCLNRWVFENLALELDAVPDAIVVPLGTVAGEVVNVLSEHRLINPSRCMIGFPHPSGANGHRKEHFAAGCRQWTDQLVRWFAVRGER